MPLPPASRLGPYEVVRLLGAGAMGEVYSARDTRLGRLVAVKLLPDVLAADPAHAVRLRQEALAASALNHPNVMAVHDVGTEGDVFFVVSELIEGQTLRERLQAGRLPADRAARLRGAGGAGPRRRARQGHRPPRPEAREPDAHRGRAGEDRGLRRREVRAAVGATRRGGHRADGAGDDAPGRRCSGPSPTCRPSSCAATRSTAGPTSSASA